MLIFGLTGGIASGKSTVSNTFKNHGVPMVDADLLARQVIEPGSIGLKTFIEEFGSRWLLPDGKLDRVNFGKWAFAQKEVLAHVTAIMSPLIEEAARQQFDLLSKNGVEMAGYDAAIIIERGMADKFRPLILVGCPTSIQVERLVKRNNLSQKEAWDRINSQMSLEDKKLVSDFFIDTSGSKEYSLSQTENIIKALKQDIKQEIKNRKNK
jgi:dephospho-CoA kinase